MTDQDDRWLTRPEVGERMQIPVKTLAQWASQGRGPRYHKFGGHVRYRLGDVIDWESSQLVGGPA
ncbi:helix-turn-helix transcriptional regulator [Mycobacteroides abscessus]|uniref:helix-turn-helix transcriptional regulator n=1 Tax=Mycobacteroides abscessus TaxID=36809 RepID=UPI0013FD036E|nr:helix-turn-helix domain-containing protein [Mycobacteroides abscessus]